jgi:hypothetical protein
MRTYHLSEVSLTEHPTAKVAGKVLRVKFRSFEDHEEVEVHADLFGFEHAGDIIFRNTVKGFDINTLNNLKDVIDSVISIVGNGTKLDWTVVDLDQRISTFHNQWKERAFRNALKIFNVTDRLTLEQACRVLMEHYLVEPVMES